MSELIPNYFQIIFERFDDLNSKIYDLSLSVQKLTERSEIKTFSVKDLAAKFGCHPRSLSNNPWRLPNFGRADVYPNRWMLKTVEDWYLRPEGERRKEWDFMNSEQRRKALGRI
ncbi:hypothetical protein FACS1894110_21320 [Spirochaetia bacterium]|nr:hypothetical protein FACS1894110_21320 [Spirochaetia bacterium]